LQVQYLIYPKYGTAKNSTCYAKLTINARNAPTYATFFIRFMEALMGISRWLKTSGKMQSSS
jgi:hypothetical protein